MPLDLYRLAGRRKPEAAGDAVFQQLHVWILELNDLVAIDANQVVMGWVLDKIWVVHRGISAHVDLAQQAALDQKGKRPIDRSARNRLLDHPGHREQLLGSEVFLRRKRRFNDRITLHRATKPFAGQKVLQTLADAVSHIGF